MAQIDSLIVQIEANTERLRRELARGDQQLSSFDRTVAASTQRIEGRFARVGAVMSKAFAPLAAAASVGALSRMARSAISTAAALGDMADALGVNVETMQGLQFAAEQSGSSADVMNQALRSLTGRLAEADKGSGSAADTFKQLGISVRDADGNLKSADAILLEVADRMRGLSSQSERAALAARIFGEDAGPKLAGLLAQGRGGIQDLIDEAPKLSSELTAAAQEIDAEFKAVIHTLTVGFQTAVVYAAQAAKWLHDEATRLTPAAERGDQIRRDLGRARDQLTTRQAINAGDLAEIAGLPSEEFLRRRVDALQRLLDRIEAPAATPETSEPPALPTIAPPPGGGGRAGAASDAEKQAEAISGVIEALRFEREQMLRNGREQAVQNALRKAGIDASHEMAPAIMEAAGAVYDLTEASRALDEIISRDAAGLFGRELEQVNVAAEEAADQMQAFGEITSSAFEDAILNGKELKDVLGGLLQDLARMGLRSASNSIFGAIGGFLGFGGGGASSALDSSIASNPDLFGFADGGEPPVGRPSIVGERGPELIVPRSPMTVFSNAQTQAMLGGGGGSSAYAPVYNIDARGADAGVVARIERALAERDRTEAQRIRAMTIDARRRLGPMERVFR